MGFDLKSGADGRKTLYLRDNWTLVTTLATAGNALQRLGEEEVLQGYAAIAARVIHELEQDSDRIGGVLDVIRGIAGQTNQGARDLEGASTELGAVATHLQPLVGTFKTA